jgi:ankyrin repeat protein
MKYTIEKDLIEILNSDPDLVYILKDYEKNVGENVENANFYLLSDLVYFSNNASIKNYLVNNIHKFKDSIHFQNKYGHDILMMHYRTGNTDIYKLLLDNGANPKLFDKHHTTALMFACSSVSSCSFNFEIVKLLLEYGSDINHSDYYGETPLMEAFVETYDDTRTIKLLLDYGANLNIKYDGGLTILMHACIDEYFNYKIYEITQLFLEYGADVNIKDNKKKTALMYICEKSNENYEYSVNITKLLIEKGAIINSKDNKG